MEMQLFCELTKKQLPFSYIWKCCTFRNNCLNSYFEKSLLINFSHTLDNLHLWTNSALLSEAAVKIDRCLKRFATFTGKHLCRSLFLITLQVFSHATVFKKSPQHGCFPVNIAKCLRTASFEHLRWLLLYFGQL